MLVLIITLLDWTRGDTLGRQSELVITTEHLCTNITGSYRMVMVTTLVPTVSEGCNCYNQVNTTLAYIGP